MLDGGDTGKVDCTIIACVGTVSALHVDAITGSIYVTKGTRKNICMENFNLNINKL